MPSGEIKTSLKLDGEQQYRSGMTNAARAVKTLDSELKLAKAQFQQSGDAQQYAADRARILKEQIEQQKAAVATAEKALQQLAAQGFEKNSREVQNWTKKLNDAKTGLTRMETDLSKAESELGQQADAFEATADSVDDYNAAITSVQTPDFAGALHALDNVQQRFDTIISTAAKAAKAIWTMEVDASQWADELATAASKASLDKTTYQSWQYASRFIDTDVETIIKERDRLSNELVNGSADIQKAFNELLVPTRNADGTVRDATATFWNVIDALHNIDDVTERDGKATKLFGKSFAELKPLIDAGSKAYLDLAASAEEAGAVVSEDGVDNLATFNDAWQKLDAQLSATKYQLLSELAPAFTEVAGAMSTAVGALNDFLKTDEGQATLQNVKDAFAGIADEFKNADVAALIEKGAGAIQKLSEGLGWIAEHRRPIVAALLGIKAALTGIQVASEVLSVVNMIKGIGGIGAAGVAGAAGAGASGAGVAGAAAGGGILAKAAGIAGKVALPAAAVYLGGRAAYALDERETERRWGRYNRLQDELPALMTEAESAEITKRQQMLAEFNAAVQAAMHPDTTDLEGDATAGIKEAFGKYANQIHELMPELEFWDWEQFSEKLAGGLDQLDLESLINDRGILAPTWTDIGREITEGLAASVEDGGGSLEDAGANAEAGLARGFALAQDAVNAATEKATEIVNAVMGAWAEHSPSKVFADIGGNAVAGLAQGIYSRGAEAIAAANWLANAVAATMRAALMIHSPSKVFETLGGYVSEGFAIGIQDGIDAVTTAASDMAEATSRGVSVPRRSRDAVGGSEAALAQVTLVLDGEVLGTVLTPIVNDTMGAEIDKAR